MKILPMAISHLNDIIRIENDSFAGDAWPLSILESELTRSNASYFSLFDDDTLIGYGGFHILYDEAEILTLAVDPKARNRGVGSMLLDYFFGIWRENNVKKVFLEVKVTNKPAISLYEKYGFKIIAIRNEYYSNKEDAFVMGLDL